MLRCITFIALLVVMSYADYVDVGDKLLDRVIHIESLRFRGYWLAARYDNYAKFTGSSEKEIYYKNWSQFLVMKCGAYVCLQSLRYPNWYLAAYYNLDVMIEKTFYPNDKIWAQWRIECTSAASMSDCRLYSPRFKNYLKTDHTYYAKTYTDMGIWLQMRILAPKPSDYYVTILSTENESNVPQKKTIKMHEGVIDTTSSTTTITTTISTEIQKGFFSASAEVSSTWETSTSKTFEKSTDITYELVIPARTKITFQQLTGKYGPFSIAAKEFKITSKRIAAGDALSNDEVKFYEIENTREYQDADAKRIPFDYRDQENVDAEAKRIPFNYRDQENVDAEAKRIPFNYRDQENVDAEAKRIPFNYRDQENVDAEAKRIPFNYRDQENVDAEAKRIPFDYHNDEDAEAKYNMRKRLRDMRFKRV